MWRVTPSAARPSPIPNGPAGFWLGVRPGAARPARAPPGRPPAGLLTGDMACCGRRRRRMNGHGEERGRRRHGDGERRAAGWMRTGGRKADGQRGPVPRIADGRSGKAPTGSGVTYGTQAARGFLVPLGTCGGKFEARTGGWGMGCAPAADKAVARRGARGGDDMERGRLRSGDRRLQEAHASRPRLRRKRRVSPSKALRRGRKVSWLSVRGSCGGALRQGDGGAADGPHIGGDDRPASITVYVRQPQSDLRLVREPVGGPRRRAWGDDRERHHVLPARKWGRACVIPGRVSAVVPVRRIGRVGVAARSRADRRPDLGR